MVLELLCAAEYYTFFAPDMEKMFAHYNLENFPKLKWRCVVKYCSVMGRWNEIKKWPLLALLTDGTNNGSLTLCEKARS